MEADALNITNGEFPLLECGTNANDVLDGLCTVLAYQDETKVSIAAHSEKPLEEGIDPVLFEKLRQLRLNISKARSVPPYAVCHDSSLADMCKLLPTNPEELRFVKGMGERKIASFGSRFLKTIREHLEEKN